LENSNNALKYVVIATGVVFIGFIWHRYQAKRDLTLHIATGVYAVMKISKQATQAIYDLKKPASNADLGLPPPESYKAEGISAVYVGDGTTITVLYDKSVLGGGQYFEYIPRLGLTNLYWRCVTSIPKKYFKEIYYRCISSQYDTENPPPTMPGSS
jgi:hypothetical protein